MVTHSWLEHTREEERREPLVLLPVFADWPLHWPLPVVPPDSVASRVAGMHMRESIIARVGTLDNNKLFKAFEVVEIVTGRGETRYSLRPIYEADSDSLLAYDPNDLGGVELHGLHGNVRENVFLSTIQEAMLQWKEPGQRVYTPEDDDDYIWVYVSRCVEEFSELVASLPQIGQTNLEAY